MSLSFLKTDMVISPATRDIERSDKYSLEIISDVFSQLSFY